VNVSAALKSIVCRMIAALPTRLWPIASRIVRRLWPGFKDA
jgi:hypothetical protein